MEERKHHPFGPSVLGRRAMCPGSYRLEAQCANVETEAAAEGTKLHEAVHNDEVAEGLSEEDFALVQAVRVHLESINTGEWKFEHCLKLVDMGGKDLLFGYADAILVDNENQIAHVVDFKFGRLELPKAMGTWQLAALCVSLEQLVGLKTRGHIFCPRTGEVWDAPHYDVDGTVEKIKSVIARCQQPDAPCSANPEACKYCRAQGVCPELGREVELVVRDKCELTPAIRAKRREFLSLVESWAEAVKEEDRQFCLNGGEIPGWELRSRHGPRFISNPYAAWKRLETYLSREALVNATKLEIGKLESAFVAAQSKEQGSKKAAEALFSVVVGDAVERKPDYVTLVRAKGNKNE